MSEFVRYMQVISIKMIFVNTSLAINVYRTLVCYACYTNNVCLLYAELIAN